MVIFTFPHTLKIPMGIDIGSNSQQIVLKMAYDLARGLTSFLDL